MFSCKQEFIRLSADDYRSVCAERNEKLGDCPRVDSAEEGCVKLVPTQGSAKEMRRDNGARGSPKGTLDNVNINFLFSRVTTNTSNFLVATHQVLPTRQSMARFPSTAVCAFSPRYLLVCLRLYSRRHIDIRSRQHLLLSGIHKFH